MAQGKETQGKRKVVITDTTDQLLTWILTGIVIFLAFATNILLGIAAVPIAIYIGNKRFKAIKDGVVVDYDKGTLSFPGGDIEANNIAQYVQPAFWTQFFHRYTVKLADIEMISAHDDSSTDVDSSGKVTVSHSYRLHIAGSFGSFCVKFKSEGKCQQCYAAIAQANDMGVPVVNR